MDEDRRSSVGSVSTERRARARVVRVSILVIVAVSVGAGADDSSPCVPWRFDSGLEVSEPRDAGGCACVVEVRTDAPVASVRLDDLLPGSSDPRLAGVVAIELDAMTGRSEPGGCGLPLTLLLRATGDDPDDPSDDDFAYLWDGYKGLLIAPCAGEGWLRFRFEIPSGDRVPLPAGWTGGHHADPMEFRPGIDWNDLMTRVDRIELWWGAPALEAPPRVWVVAVDAIEIEVAVRASNIDRPVDLRTAPGWDQSPIAVEPPFGHIDGGP